MVAEDKDYDILLERNKLLEAENSEIKAKLDIMIKQVATLTEQLNKFMERSTKRKKRNGSAVNKGVDVNMDQSETDDVSLVRMLKTGPDGGEASCSYPNNNNSNNAPTRPHASDTEGSSEKNYDNCIWRNVISKKQYQQNKKQNANNDSETNTTPIQLNTMSADDTSTLIKSLFSKFHGKGYIFQQIKNKSNPRILTDNERIKNDIMKFLDSRCYEYNSYNNKSEKKKSFILRGFCCNDDSENIEAIKTALDSAGFSDCAVTRFLTGYQRGNPNKTHNVLYRIVVDNDVADETLTGIRTIGFFGIRIEKMRASKVVQCYNCQRFNHTAGQCHFIYRCVQCIDPHGPQQCPRKLNSNFPLGCINCQEAKLDYTGHTANDLKNCPFYQNKTTPTINKTTNHSSMRTNNQPAKFKPNLNSTTNSSNISGKNFASVIRGTSTAENIDPSQILAMFSQFAEPLSKLCQILKNAQK